MDRKEICADAIRQRILRLDIAPGAAIDETETSTEFGLSRTPVREVFQMLIGEGYLTREANRGTTVSPMDIKTMRSFFQTAPLVYATVARLAAENGSLQGIDRLKAIQKEFRKAVKANDASGMSISNHRFHSMLGDMSGNPYLRPSLECLLIDHTRMSHRFYRPRKSSSKSRVTEAARHHDQMIDAIEARDSDLIIEVTLQHWDLSRNEIEKYVIADPLPLSVAG